ncbi:MAG: hypothetical protein AAGG68_23455 [Bacteroidota bacterium]
MGKTIRQTFRGNFKKYEITEKGLALESKNSNDYIAYNIEYEDLGFDEIVRKFVPSRFEYAIFFSILLNLILIGVLLHPYITLKWLQFILVIIAAGLVFVWAKNLFKFRKIKILEGDQNISFFYFENQQEEVDTFIKDLKTYRKKYLRRKYMKYDELDDEDVQKSVYTWLYKEKIITREEYRDLTDEINNGRIIGGY